MYSVVARVAFVFILAVGCISAAKLPKYISPCKRYSADLNACVKKEIINALPYVLDGDKTLKLPNMKPFKLPEVSLKSGSNLKIKLTDLNIYGLEDNFVKDASLDIKQQHFQLKLLMHRLNLQSQYEIGGRILVLPITGSGPCNITFVEADFTFDVDFDLEVRNGKEYIKLKNPKLQYTTKREHYHFDNLFNGDQRLGEETNRFLNENSKVLLEEMSPAIVEIVNAIVLSIARPVFNQFSSTILLPVN